MADERFKILISALGAYVLGAVYLLVVGGAAIAAGNTFAMFFVLLAAASGYGVQIADAFNKLVIVWPLWALSLLSATFAGIAVVWGL